MRLHPPRKNRGWDAAEPETGDWKWDHQGPKLGGRVWVLEGRKQVYQRVKRVGVSAKEPQRRR